MKIVGIIAEYNPFHNGHLYHLQAAKAKTGADGIICILSGNFLQRGEPALLDKWERTKMALAGGADLIIELPVPYALRSAEFFAYGGISLLDATGVVNYVAFGSETGDLEKLTPLAKILADEPPVFTKIIRTHLDTGLSYPSARTEALVDYIRQSQYADLLTQSEVKSLVSTPNNILGLEYLKAIYRLESKITAVTIQRVTSGYHDLSIENSIASATAIRENIRSRYELGEELFEEQLLQTLPEASRKLMREAFNSGKGPVLMEHFAPQILTLVRRANLLEISNLFDVQGGLERRIKEAAEQATSLHDLIERIKTKRFTWTRIQRTIFHLLLNLTSVKCEYFDQLGGPQYLRVLGFNTRGQYILAKMREEAKLPIIMNLGKVYRRGGTPEPVNKMIEQEILASDLYSLVIPNKNLRVSNRDLIEQVIIWK